MTHDELVEHAADAMRQQKIKELADQLEVIKTSVSVLFPLKKASNILKLIGDGASNSVSHALNQHVNMCAVAMDSVDGLFDGTKTRSLDTLEKMKERSRDQDEGVQLLLDWERFVEGVDSFGASFNYVLLLVEEEMYGASE